jgi:hypothetical protein
MRHRHHVLPVLLLAAPWLGACADGEAVGTAAPAPAAPVSFTLDGRDPTLRFDATGGLHVLYVDETGDDPRVAYYRHGTEPFGPVTVSLTGTNAHGEVPPTLAVLPDGTLLAAYTVPLPGRFKGEIRLQRSTDGGATWSEPVVLHDDGGGNGSHSFLTSTVNARGEAVFAWLDNRSGQQGLRVATTADGVELTPNATVDAVTCQCCATELLPTGGGAIALAYRDTSEGGARDVFLATSTDGGRSFGEPRPVSVDDWKIDACPHTGPRLAEGADGRLWTVWFTGAEPGIYAAASADGGRSFTPRQGLARMGEGHTRHVAHPELGRLPDGRLLAVWEQAIDAGDGEVRRSLTGRRLEGDRWSEPFEVAPEGTYPRLATAPDGRTVLAYTRHRAEGNRLVVAAEM